MNEKLIDWLWEHPKEAQGINITMTGGDVILLFKRALEWCKLEYKNMQQPLRLTTEEACRTYKVSAKHLYNLSHSRELDGKTIEPVLHPSYVGNKNMYLIDELEKVLMKRSPSRGARVPSVSEELSTEQ